MSAQPVGLRRRRGKGRNNALPRATLKAAKSPPLAAVERDVALGEAVPVRRRFATPCYGAGGFLPHSDCAGTLGLDQDGSCGTVGAWGMAQPK